jgi:hypothetical protein
LARNGWALLLFNCFFTPIILWPSLLKVFLGVAGESWKRSIMIAGVISFSTISAGNIAGCGLMEQLGRTSLDLRHWDEAN